MSSQKTICFFETNLGDLAREFLFGFYYLSSNGGFIQKQSFPSAPHLGFLILFLKMQSSVVEGVGLDIALD